MDSALARVRADFDRIALLSDTEPLPLGLHVPWLLRQLPPRGAKVLDLGCGSGAVTRELAMQGYQVTACDLSTSMLRLARQRAGINQIEFIAADFLDPPWPPQSFDAIVAVAVLHHVSWDLALPILRDLVRPGGVLLIQDLWQPGSLADHVRSLAAWPTSRVLRRLQEGRSRKPKELREAWARHGEHEQHPTVATVRALCRRHLPEARVHQHLCWRFSIIWQRPSSKAAA